MGTRLSRLNQKERGEAHSLLEDLGSPSSEDKNVYLAKLGNLFAKADAYNAVTLDTGNLEVQYHIYQGVWNAAAKLRKSGKLLKIGTQIQCPVVAIHGDFDPHPSEGVQKPLASILRKFRFILLKNCGHRPWLEREARSEFFEILKKELAFTC